MPIVTFDQEGNRGKVAFDAKTVDRIEKSVKEAVGSPVTLIFRKGVSKPLRVAKAFNGVQTDLTTGGWGT